MRFTGIKIHRPSRWAKYRYASVIAGLLLLLLVGIGMMAYGFSQLDNALVACNPGVVSTTKNSVKTTTLACTGAHR